MSEKQAIYRSIIKCSLNHEIYAIHTKAIMGDKHLSVPSIEKAKYMQIMNQKVPDPRALRPLNCFLPHSFSLSLLVLRGSRLGALSAALASRPTKVQQIMSR